MSESRGPRPTHTTLAGWLTVSASVFLVASLFSSIPGLRSLESRRTWEEALAEPGLSGLGLSIDEVLTGLYVLSLVAAACATATAILGVFVLRGDRQARLAVSVLAVPLFLAGFLTGGLLSAVVAIAVVMLWLQPSRDWFDGKAPATAASSARSSTTASTPRAAPPPAHPSDPTASSPEPPGAPRPWGRPADEPSAGRAHEGFGDAPGAVATQQRPAWGPAPDAAYPTDGAPAPAPRRPVGVLLACLSAGVFSGIAVLLFGTSLVAVLTSPDDLTRELLAQDPALAEAGLTPDVVRVSAAVMSGLFVVWALVSIVLAALAFRGSQGARIALVVSAAVVAVPGAFAALFGPPLFVLVVAAVVTLVGLLRADARAWYAARRARRTAPGPGGQWG